MTLQAAADTYRQAEEAQQAARAALYRAVRRAHKGGRSVRKIAAEVGMSSARVHQIVQGL